MISVIIPLYNKEKYIRKCLLSVLNQTYTDIEVIIVDDGSTDASLSVIETIKDPRIRLVRKQNGGPSSARNKGILEAKGEWIVFLDADDIFLPYALEYMYNLINDNPGLNYYCCNYFIQINGNISLFSYRRFEGIIPNNFYYEFIEHLTDRPGSAIYRKSIFLEDSFNEKLRRYEDAEVQYRILKKNKVFQSWIPIMITNRDASSAACFRKSIDEDFIGHLEFKSKSIWERMQLYKLAREIQVGYPNNMNKYPELKRLDYYLIYIISRYIIRLLKRIYLDNNPINCTSLTYDYLIEVTDYKQLIK